MLRGLALAMLFLALPSVAAIQEPGLLTIRIVLQGSGQISTPVRRHALLISDNPASAAPRRVLTAQDGTVEVRLPPGNYTVESDRPVAFDGRVYQWTQFVDIVAGGDVLLELTAANADVESATGTTGAASALDEDASSLSTQWLDSVAGVWTPTAHASGFVIDRDGLVVTSARAIGPATSVEVQFSPTLKVAANVVVTDAERDVAVVQIHQAAAASVKAVPLGCGESGSAPVEGERIFAVEAPLRQQKGTVSGSVRRVTARVIESDIAAATGGSGGPVFTTKGAAIGITSEPDDGHRRGDTRVVPMRDVCAVVELARTKLDQMPAPEATGLPVEPVKPYPTSALEDAMARRAGNLNPYQISSDDFDISFLTPVHVYAGQQRPMGAGRPSQPPDAGWLLARLVTDFGEWSEYVADIPPVVVIRVTPRLVESFWAKMARGAAYTQGVALPPLTRLRSGFSRMRLFCGDTEMRPIHPFVIEEEVSETETIAEGLYIFDAGALSPSCGTVRLSLHSRKNPEKVDTRVVEPRVLQQVWDDFEPYRAQP